MSKPQTKIVNAQTGEEIIREMTNAEYSVWQADIELQNEAKAEAEAKAQAKATAQAKLAALGLTISDLEALGL